MLAATVDDGSLATIAGHSLGAMAIAAWAPRHVNTRARAAVLINTGFGDLIAGNLLVTGAAARFRPERDPCHPWLGRTVPGLSSPFTQAAIRRIAFGPTATHGQVAFYERMLIECPADVRAAVGLALSDMDLLSGGLEADRSDACDRRRQRPVDTAVPRTSDRLDAADAGRPDRPSARGTCRGWNVPNNWQTRSRSWCPTPRGRPR